MTFAVIVAAGASPARSMALEVLFDNLSEGSNGASSVSNTQWPAQAFTTTEEGYILSEVSVRLWNSSPAATGSYEFLIWDATGTGGQPGAQVGSVFHSGNAGTLSSTSGNLVTISDLSVTLSPGTTYYLVLRGVNLVVDNGEGPEPGFLNWGQTSTNTTPNYVTGNSGSSWLGPFSRNMYMSVSAVPEPSTWAMGAAGLVVLGWSRRRRFVKAAA